MNLELVRTEEFNVDFDRQSRWYLAQAGEDVAERFFSAVLVTLRSYFPRVRERISLEFPCGASGIVVGFGDTQKTQDVALKRRELRGKPDR